MDMQALLEAIDQLPPEQLDQLQEHIRERQHELRISPPIVASKIGSLDAAIAKFREGLSEDDLNEIFQAMNAKYISSDDLKSFDWLNDLPENER